MKELKLLVAIVICGLCRAVSVDRTSNKIDLLKLVPACNNTAPHCAEGQYCVSTLLNGFRCFYLAPRVLLDDNGNQTLVVDPSSARQLATGRIGGCNDAYNWDCAECCKANVLLPRATGDVGGYYSKNSRDGYDCICSVRF